MFCKRTWLHAVKEWHHLKREMRGRRREGGGGGGGGSGGKGRLGLAIVDFKLLEGGREREREREREKVKVGGRKEGRGAVYHRLAL